MWTDDGKIGVVFNGVIYNNRDLCEALTTRGHILQTSYSNTEILLHAYREWGEHTAEHLDGVWAFAIYDKERNRLILSRDRFGKKPLFYTFRSGTFIFSSELISLLSHPMSRCSLSILSLKKYFAYGFIPSPNSMFESVYKLQAGHNLVYDIKGKKCFIDKNWEFKLEPLETTPQEPEKVWGEQLCDLLNKAVKKRMFLDDSPGVFLSGGIDSTSVAYFASKYTSSLKTISIGFEEPSFDESRYSKYAAGIINSTHFHSMFLFEIVREMLDEIIGGLIEPIGDSSLISTYLLCKEARKHMTIALGGDGADELFAGYDPIKALRTAEVYSKLLPHPVHKTISMLVSRLPVSHSNMSLDFKLKRTLRVISYDRKLWNPIWLGPLDPAGVEKLLEKKPIQRNSIPKLLTAGISVNRRNPIDKTLQFYTHYIFRMTSW
jgi:asparagine synthase (glutamine-hydrolysing)